MFRPVHVLKPTDFNLLFTAHHCLRVCVFQPLLPPSENRIEYDSEESQSSQDEDDDDDDEFEDAFDPNAPQREHSNHNSYR